MPMKSPGATPSARDVRIATHAPAREPSVGCPGPGIGLPDGPARSTHCAAFRPVFNEKMTGMGEEEAGRFCFGGGDQGLKPLATGAGPSGAGMRGAPRRARRVIESARRGDRGFVWRCEQREFLAPSGGEERDREGACSPGCVRLRRTPPVATSLSPVRGSKQAMVGASEVFALLEARRSRGARVRGSVGSKSRQRVRGVLSRGSECDARGDRREVRAGAKGGARRGHERMVRGPGTGCASILSPCERL